ncbi:MAG TPA: LLM class flavin-dependent oxidoreductase [Baekduia sp.]|uniref:LLM class flavin-dependent oxidoreductase n=1 Tax=Baekduia sp. TaxID=2600305 RepID=UPI002D780653|nr:LLM class flavin-dependent oxidoreductase [Baekduia sp.]HET6507026.1 LLM class flavin-dependent oxidoreductase [Baekduia sp.]
MRVGYLIDTNAVLDGSAPPTGASMAATMDAMVEEGLLAERAGFHSVQVPDRHARPECCFPAPEQLLTILARETERVMLGSFTHVATLTHPMKSAEQFSVIDNLSGGRLVTTVSRGFLPAFWEQFGIPRERLLGRFQEALKIWRAATSGEEVVFDGEFWTVDRGRLAPPPFQDGGWPIWGGGNASPAAVARSARYADAWTCDPMPMARAAWDEHAGLYRDSAREQGKRPFVVLMRDGWVADSFDEAARTFGEHFVRVARFYLKTGNLTRHPGLRAPEDITPQSVAPHLVMGTPEQCVERLQELHEDLGVDYVVLCCRLTTGPSLQATREQILRMGEEVVAPIHARYPAPDHPAIPAACRW